MEAEKCGYLLTKYRIWCKEKSKKGRDTSIFLGVRFTAQALAMRFGEDVMKAGYAGVLHDCAKYLSDKEMLLACRKRQIFLQ